MDIVKDFIPRGRRNRPEHSMSAKWITIHDTGNSDAGADAAAHARYLKGDAAANRPVSWHFTVDEDNVYQHLPLDENGWHAEDGSNGQGNRMSIGVEICMNSDGDRPRAEARAAKLVAWLLQTVDSLKDYPGAVKQHHDWTGKNCPRVLRGRSGGWQEFLDAVKEALHESDGELHRVQVGAYSQYGNAVRMRDRLKADGYDTYLVLADDGLYKVQTGAFSKRSNATRLAERLENDGYETYITTKGREPAQEPTIEEGDRVKVRRGARTYTGGGLADFVYDNVYEVLQLRDDRAVIGRSGAVTAAVNVDDLIKQ